LPKYIIVYPIIRLTPEIVIFSPYFRLAGFAESKPPLNRQLFMYLPLLGYYGMRMGE
jgi:hypothetical protein